MNILLVGNGNMATEIKSLCIQQNIRVIRMDELTKKQGGEPIIAIHVGSGRELPDLIAVCEKRMIPIIQGSTWLDIPTGHNVAIINIPNFSEPMIAFMRMFPAFANGIKKGMRVTMTESHQSNKKDVSGTARYLAQKIGITTSDIESIRDNVTYGVHAHHTITFTDDNVEITVTTKVTGRKTYAEGAVQFARELAARTEPYPAGVHRLKE